MRSDAGEVIASRVFERDDGQVELHFHRPAPWPDPEHDADPDDPPWRCFYTIHFPDGETKRSYSVGIDGVQALLLAMEGAWVSLRYTQDRTGNLRPAVRRFGSDDLGFEIRDLPALR